MIDIESPKEKKIKNFVKLILQNEAFIDKNILLKEISENNIGFTSLNEIDPKEKILLIPSKLLITKENFTNFLLNKKLNFYDEELINLYFSILPNLTFFKENNFLYLKQSDINISLNLFKNDSPIKKSIETLFKNFNKLENDIEKYIFLLFRTRSFRVNGQSYLAPLLDSMNYNFNTRGYFVENESVYLNSEKKLKKNEEIFHSYNLKVDPIKFFLNYSFFPTNYSNLTFSENQLILNVSKSTIPKIDSKYWNIYKDQAISNKNSISFYDCKVPLILNLMFESLSINNNLKNKTIYNFLTVVKNQFNINEINLCVENKNYNPILNDFAKSIKLYVSNLDKILENILN